MQSLIVVTPTKWADQSALRAKLSQVCAVSQALWQFPHWGAKILPIAYIKDEFLSRLTQSGGEHTTVFVFTNLGQSKLATQNALLKSLEEPPAKVLLVIVTASLSSLLPTIISRCRIVTLGAEPSLSSTTPPLLATTNLTADISPLAAELITLVTTEAKNRQDLAKKLNFDDKTITLSTVVDDLLLDWGRWLSATANPEHATLLKALSLALRHLHANVSPKNVLYQLAIDVKLPFDKTK